MLGFDVIFNKMLLKREGRNICHYLVRGTLPFLYENEFPLLL